MASTSCSKRLLVNKKFFLIQNSFFPCTTMYCQVPTPANLRWDSLNVTTDLNHHPPTRIVVWITCYISDLFIICVKFTWLFHDLFRHEKLIHNVFMYYFLLVHNFFRGYSWLDLFQTHDHLIILILDSAMTSSRSDDITKFVCPSVCSNFF